MTTTVVNNKNGEIYLELSETLIEDTVVPRCNPLEITRVGRRYIFSFSGFFIETPMVDIYGNPFWANSTAVLKASNGAHIRIEFGERHPSSWNKGEMVLPDRHDIKRVFANGYDVTKAFVNPLQPWVKDDRDSVLYKMYDIYQNLFISKVPYFT